MTMGDAQAGRSAGPLRRLGASLLALARIRLELLAIEVQEEAQRIAELVFWSVVAGLLASFALVFVTLFITVLLWDSQRLLALGLAAGVFVSLACLGVWRLRQLLNAGSSLFDSSIGELRDDGQALAGPDAR